MWHFLFVFINVVFYDNPPNAPCIPTKYKRMVLKENYLLRGYIPCCSGGEKVSVQVSKGKGVQQQR